MFREELPHRMCLSVSEWGKKQTQLIFCNDFELPVISEQVKGCVFLMDNKWRPSKLFMVLKKKSLFLLLFVHLFIENMHLAVVCLLAQVILKTTMKSFFFLLKSFFNGTEGTIPIYFWVFSHPLSSLQIQFLLKYPSIRFQSILMF